MYKVHSHCRACGYGKAGASGIKAAASEKLIEVMDLGVQPLANDFVREGMHHAGYAPLQVLYCPKCSLAQLSVVVDPTILYRIYSYVTSPSQMMREHFKNLITDIAKETDGKKVLEIGSNDGRFLAMMRDGGKYEVTGVDPAENLAAIAESDGIPTRIGFFGSKMGVALAQYDIVIARHVFCHVDDWQDFVRGLELVSHLETLVCIEVPYAGDTIKNCEFDTIYHEHLSYLTIRSMKALLEDTELRIDRVIRYNIHGGAIVLLLRNKDKLTNREPAAGDDISDQEWVGFDQEARRRIHELRELIGKLTGEGGRVAALGASAKSTVWISACKFTRKDIAFISDNTPQKQWTFSPGTDIPVCDEGALMRELPDYVVVFCWNFLPEILEKFKDVRAKGVKFIVPVPEVKVI